MFPCIGKSKSWKSWKSWSRESLPAVHQMGIRKRTRSKHSPRNPADKPRNGRPLAEIFGYQRLDWFRISRPPTRRNFDASAGAALCPRSTQRSGGIDEARSQDGRVSSGSNVVKSYHFKREILLHGRGRLFSRAKCSFWTNNFILRF